MVLSWEKQERYDGETPLPLLVGRGPRTTGPGLCPAVPASCSPAADQKSEITEKSPSGGPGSLSEPSLPNPEEVGDK